MRRALIGAGLVVFASCGGGSSPTSPTPPPPAATYSLNGSVTSSETGSGVSGATVQIADGPNANKSATTDGTGRYTLSGLAPSGFTVNFSATNYVSASAGIDLTANKTLDQALAPTPLFNRSGEGDTVFDLPASVTRVRIVANYPGATAEFIVHIDGSEVVNQHLGTDPDQVHFEGTYLAHGGVVEILHASGVRWLFTEVR